MRTLIVGACLGFALAVAPAAAAVENPHQPTTYGECARYGITDPSSGTLGPYNANGTSAQELPGAPTAYARSGGQSRFSGGVSCNGPD